MPYVTSEAISRIEHDEHTLRMEVTFRETQKTYSFCNVPRGVYTAFVGAPSHGRYFNDHIKDRYPC
jgi:hypothetical protein